MHYTDKWTRDREHYYRTDDSGYVDNRRDVAKCYKQMESYAKRWLRHDIHTLRRDSQDRDGREDKA